MGFFKVAVYREGAVLGVGVERRRRRRKGGR